jgi:hypothetical protein
MFQRTLRWNGVWVLLALALVFGLAAPTPAQAQVPAGAWEVASALQSWWSGLWGTKTAAAHPPAPTDPTRTDFERGSTLDPNGLRSTAPTRELRTHGEGRLRSQV